MTRLRCFVFVFVLVSMCLVTPAVAQNSEDEEFAAQLYERAAVAYKDGEYEQAVKWLEQAYSLDQDPVIKYNLGRSYEGLGQLDKAETLLREVRTDPGTPTEILKRINTDLKRISNLKEGRKQVGQLTLNTNPAGARIFIDGKNEGTTPFAVSLDVGSYDLLLQLDGYESVEQSFNIEQDQTTAIELPMVSLTGTDDPPPTPGGGGSWASSGLAIASYVSLGVGVIGVGLGVATYFVASSEHEFYSDETNDTADRLLAQDNGKQMSTISVIGYGVGFAGIGIGAALLVWAVLADDGATEEESVDLIPDWANANPLDGTLSVGWRW